MKSWFLFIFVFFIVESVAQNSTVFRSSGVVETDLYHNLVIPFEDGFFIACTTEESNSDLILSKYNICNDHVWTKRYNTSYDLDVYDAIINQGSLVILLVTHFNSSSTRTPILLSLSFDGEIVFANIYNKDRFDNFINLSCHDDNYHIFGPSTDFPDGGGHFVIDKNGNSVSGNVLLNINESNGADFGCTILENGTSVRRFNNDLVACDQNQNVIWAKQFPTINTGALNEIKPLALPDGFFQIFNEGKELVLFKMDFQGNVVWSIRVEGNNYYSAAVLNSGNISLVWGLQFSDSETRLAFIELDDESGDVLTNKYLEFDEGERISWPSHAYSPNGELLITGSRSSADMEYVDFLFVNPLDSECLSDFDINVQESISLILEDVTQEYEIVTVDVLQSPAVFNVVEIETLLEPKCEFLELYQIDTSLNCSGVYVFEEMQEGLEFLWSDGRTDSIRTFVEPTDISVMVNGCEYDREISLIIKQSDCECQIFIPNIINESATNLENSQLNIFTDCNFEDYILTIYDRWGNLVFESNDQNESWRPGLNGNWNQGVYAWVLEWRTIQEKEENIQSGTVTLMKKF